MAVRGTRLAQLLSSVKDIHLPDSDAPADRAYRIRLANRLTELRLGIDLGEIRTPIDFENELERDGGFTAHDPRVRNACAVAGLGGWLTSSVRNVDQ